jgi:hypothetical protein
MRVLLLFAMSGSRVAELLSQMDLQARKQQMLAGLQRLHTPHYGAPLSLVGECIPQTPPLVVRDLASLHGRQYGVSSSPLRATPLGEPRAASPLRAPSPGRTTSVAPTSPTPQWDRGSSPTPQWDRGSSPTPQWDRGSSPTPQWDRGSSPTPQWDRGSSPTQATPRARSPSPQQRTHERPVWIPGGSPGVSPRPRRRSPSPLRAPSAGAHLYLAWFLLVN